MESKDKGNEEIPEVLHKIGEAVEKANEEGGIDKVRELIERANRARDTMRGIKVPRPRIVVPKRLTPKELRRMKQKRTHQKRSRRRNRR